MILQRLSSSNHSLLLSSRRNKITRTISTSITYICYPNQHRVAGNTALATAWTPSYFALNRSNQQCCDLHIHVNGDSKPWDQKSTKSKQNRPTDRTKKDSDNNNSRKIDDNENNNNNNNSDNETFSSSLLDDYKVVKGKIVDNSMDLRMVRIGDKLDIPYELTVSETMVDFWHASFYSQDRIHTSKPFCRKLLGLQDRVLPFSLVLFLTTSMSHADAAKVQVGYGKVSYLWPTFVGDTFTKTFTVSSIRNTSDNKNSIIHFTCDLFNHRGRLCMRADKRMMYPFTIPSATTATATTVDSTNDNNAINNLFRDHLISKATILSEQKTSQSLTKLYEGQCILHSMNRSLTFTQSQQLASLARLTHERHFDIQKFSTPTLQKGRTTTGKDLVEETNPTILIPGGLILGLTMSVSARDLHEILHEQIISVNYFNTLSPNTIVGAISYISKIDRDSVLTGHELELLTVQTIGIKNLDVKKDLLNVDIPLSLFNINNTHKSGATTTTTDNRRITKKEIEYICKMKCPILQNKIVVQIERKILRQTNSEQVFLL